LSGNTRGNMLSYGKNRSLYFASACNGTGTLQTPRHNKHKTPRHQDTKPESLSRVNKIDLFFNLCGFVQQKDVSNFNP